MKKLTNTFLKSLVVLPVLLAAFLAPLGAHAAPFQLDNTNTKSHIVWFDALGGGPYAVHGVQVEAAADCTSKNTKAEFKATLIIKNDGSLVTDYHVLPNRGTCAGSSNDAGNDGKHFLLDCTNYYTWTLSTLGGNNIPSNAVFNGWSLYRTGADGKKDYAFTTTTSLTAKTYGNRAPWQEGTPRLVPDINGVSNDSSMAIYATWQVPSNNLTVKKEGTGKGTVVDNLTPKKSIDCGELCTTAIASYDTSLNVTLTATATSGAFTGWSGDCTGTGACVVPMSQAHNVTAIFTLAGDASCRLNPMYAVGKTSITKDSDINIEFYAADSTSASLKRTLQDGTITALGNIAINPDPTKPTVYKTDKLSQSSTYSVSLTGSNGKTGSSCNTTVVVTVPTLSCSVSPPAGDTPLVVKVESKPTSDVIGPFDFEMNADAAPADTLLQSGKTSPTLWYTYSNEGIYKIRARAGNVDWTNCPAVNGNQPDGKVKVTNPTTSDGGIIKS
jgi:hypothetical protein